MKKIFAHRKKIMAKYAAEHIKCIVFGSPNGEYHHVYHQGTYPNAPWMDEPWNMIPLSHPLHVMFHNKGNEYMVKKFPAIRAWFEKHGWEYDSFSKKWWHEK